MHSSKDLLQMKFWVPVKSLGIFVIMVSVLGFLVMTPIVALGDVESVIISHLGKSILEGLQEGQLPNSHHLLTLQDPPS